MKRNIIIPDIAVNFSLKAYHSAAKEFNKKQEQKFKKDKSDNLSLTVKALQLKETHHQVFYTIINYYREKIQALNKLFHGSSDVMTHINPKRSMYVTTGRIAKHLERSNSTIRKRLARLEKADIIKVVFHGHKKPLEIIFNKNVCIIFDRSNPENISKSKFIKEYLTDVYGFNIEKVQNKESTLSGTHYNNTITKNAGTTETEIIRKADFQISNETLAEDETENKQKERKKVPQKKERKERTIKEIREAKFLELKEKARIKQMNASERKQYYEDKYKKEHLTKQRKYKAEISAYYSLEFFSYMMSALFADKHLSSYYRIDTLNYISKHYFSKAKSVKEMKFLLNNYKKRIDISRKWIQNYKNKTNGSSFDTTYFYPLAFLNVEKTGKRYLSFANTEKFIKKESEWKKMNGYNRNTDKFLIHELNKTVKKLQNGFIDYDTAFEKVKSLSNKTDEYVKQFNARYFGMYKTMPNIIKS